VYWESMITQRGLFCYLKIFFYLHFSVVIFSSLKGRSQHVKQFLSHFCWDMVFLTFA
jgi:hypothetical protein